MDSLDIIPDPKQKSEHDPEFYRYHFVQNFEMPNNFDWGLAIPADTEVPKHLLEIFVRFFKLDYLWRFGGRCIFMSNLLRRILRLHGYEAHTRQVILTYEHDTEDWGFQMGSPNNTFGADQLDVHMVVVCEGWILDFTVLPALWGRQGMRAPLAFIAKDDIEGKFQMQNFGDYGRATWVPRRPRNDYVKHWTMENRDEEKQIAKEYFKIYRMARHDARRDLT